MDPAALNNLSPSQQEELKQRMAVQVQQQQIQEIVQVTTEVCIKKCTGTSGNQLDKKVSKAL